MAPPGNNPWLTALLAARRANAVLPTPGIPAITSVLNAADSIGEESRNADTFASSSSRPTRLLGRSEEMVRAKIGFEAGEVSASLMARNCARTERIEGLSRMAVILSR